MQIKGLKGLSEELGEIIGEGRAKKVRKQKTRKRAEEADKALARQIGAAMKVRVADIERLLPSPWEFGSPLVLDKMGFKRGDAYMSNNLQADYGMRISREGDTATAEFMIGCYSYDNGNGVVCGATVSDFNPVDDGEDAGVAAKNLPQGGEFSVESEWKRGKKAFDTSKDLWTLIKAVMKEVQKNMPDYEEWYVFD